MDKEDYLHKGLRQLSNDSHCELLEEDPTQGCNNQIHQVLQQATNLNIIDDKTIKTLHKKSPRTPTFYMLCKNT